MANNLDILDGAGVTKTVKSTDNASVHTPHHNVDALASGAIVSGAVASGAIASGAVASGAFASGALASGSIASGAIAAGAIAAGATSIAENEDVASASGDRGVKMLVVQLATPTDLAGTDGDYAFLQMSGGRLWCSSVVTGTVAVTKSGTWDITNAGTFAVQVNGDALTSLQLIDDAVYTDDAAFTPGTSKIIGVGFEADESSTDSVDEGDIGAARMTLDRKVITTPQPHTSGGLSISRDIDLDNGTLTVVKNAAGQLYGWTITNTTTATVYVKFYDAASGTLGTGTPVLTIGIPGNSSDDTTLAQSFGGLGIVFATGICVGAGTGVADADNTDPGANGVVANIYYK